MSSSTADADVQPDVPAGRADSLRSLEREVAVLVRRVKRAVGMRARAIHPDLQAGAYIALLHVDEHGPLRASELCTLLDLDKGALSRQVQHLLDLGLLDREPDPDDARATLLSLSAEARRRLDAFAQVRLRWLDDRLAGWDDGDVDAFVSSLGRYNTSLGSL